MSAVTASDRHTPAGRELVVLCTNMLSATPRSRNGARPQQASRHAGCFTAHAGDGDQGDKLSAKFYDGTKFLDLGQPGELHSGISSSLHALDAPAWRTWSRGAWQAKLRRKAPGS